MSSLSFPVICGVVLIYHAFLLTPVLPYVTPDLNIVLENEVKKENLLYEIENSHEHLNRLKRQVTLPPEQIPDKNEFNKVSPTKKPIGEPKSVATLQPLDSSSTNSNGLNQNLPARKAGAKDPNEDVSNLPFLDEDMLFDGNSSYPNQLQNNTYYQQQNVTLTKLGKFKYYHLEHDTDGVKKYWIDMQTHKKAKMHDMLSNAHRRAATVKPLFPILFYGHQVHNITVATGGFIYLGEQVHAWLAATQYVAPLMANFDSSTSINATVNIINEENFITVEWNQVRLQDSPSVGPFTFQTTLYKNGTMLFVYKTIPIPITAINDTHHPVKVGLSDAYINDKNMFFVRQKTIYEYHRIDIKQQTSVNITNGTAIIFTPLTTCLEFKTCEDCATADITFKCAWCPAANRCSNGTDRLYQNWVTKGCDKATGNFTEESQCAAATRDASYNVAYEQGHDNEHDHDTHKSDDKSSDLYVKKIKAAESEGMSATGVIGVMFLMMMVFGAIGWLAYAYFFPHSPSGQALIRYRPSQWAFRRGEARYTAASIHM